jgi:hypothetical protein
MGGAGCGVEHSAGAGAPSQRADLHRSGASGIFDFTPSFLQRRFLAKSDPLPRQAQDKDQEVEQRKRLLAGTKSPAKDAGEKTAFETGCSVSTHQNEHC